MDVKGFNIRPGNYLIPGFGTLNTSSDISEEMLVLLCLNKDFPFIRLKPEGVKVLKRAKLQNEDVARLIQQAKTTEEIDLILKVKSNKILRNIAGTKAAALEK